MRLGVTFVTLLMICELICLNIFGKKCTSTWLFVVYYSLQMIKLLGVEKGKKSRINLVFVAGDRVLKYLTACYEREKKFTQLLK